MRAVWIIAAWTVAERRREPWPVALALGVCLIALGAFMGGQLSVSAPTRGAAEAALFAAWGLGVIAAAALGRTLGEALDDGTAHQALLGPIGRAPFVVGRLLGAALCNAGVQLAWSSATLACAGADPVLAARCVALLLESLVVMAVSAALSTVLPPGASALATLALVLAGHLLPDALAEAAPPTSPLYGALQGAALLLPRLDRFDLGPDAVPSPLVWAGLTAQSLSWFTLCGALCVLIVHRRERW